MFLVIPLFLRILINCFLLILSEPASFIKFSLYFLSSSKFAFGYFLKVSKPISFFIGQNSLIKIENSQKDAPLKTPHSIISPSKDTTRSNNL